MRWENRNFFKKSEYDVKNIGITVRETISCVILCDAARHLEETGRFCSTVALFACYALPHDISDTRVRRIGATIYLENPALQYSQRKFID